VLSGRRKSGLRSPTDLRHGAEPPRRIALEC